MTGTQAWQYGPLAPVTWYLGFIRAPAQNIADALVKQGRNTGKSVSTVELDGGLADAVAALAPFTRRYYARKVIISTESEWCAIVNNSAIGFDPRPLVSHLAAELGVLGVLVRCAPYEGSPSSKKTSRNQATSFELYGPTRDERSSNLIRAISLVQDGPRWHFILDGELQEFEELDHYADASVRSRFTEELLERYCSAVGVRLFDTGFYGSGLLVESSLPDNLGPEALQPVSFEDLRRSSGLQRYWRSSPCLDRASFLPIEPRARATGGAPTDGDIAVPRGQRRPRQVVAYAIAIAIAIAAGGLLAPTVAEAATPGSCSIQGVVSLGTKGKTAEAGDVEVRLYQEDEVTTTFPRPAVTSTTDSAGRFCLTAPSDGFWKLQYVDVGEPGRYAPLWFVQGRGSTTHSDRATGLRLSEWPSSGPWDMTLPLGSAIAGVIRDSSGGVPDGIGGRWVQLIRTDPLREWNDPEDRTEVRISADGSYSATGLLSGNYSLEFARSDSAWAQHIDALSLTANGAVPTQHDFTAYRPSDLTINSDCSHCPPDLYTSTRVERATSDGWVPVPDSRIPMWQGSVPSVSLEPGVYRGVVQAAGEWIGTSGPVTINEGDFRSATVSLHRLVTQRVAGADRYDTSAAASSFAVDGAPVFAPGVAVAFIASGTNYPDALSAAPAAAHLGGPLLLTAPGSLPDRTSAELRRLRPKRVVVVGGPASVTDDVVARIGDVLGQDSLVERVAGADRFATSRAIAAFAFERADQAFIVTGTRFPDALTAGGAAAKVDAPVLLVDGNASSVDGNTVDLLKALHATSARIVGGTAAVSSGIESSVSARSQIPVERSAGDDRYATADRVGWDVFTSAPRATDQTAVLALGTNFPDAMSGGALAGRLDAPLIIAPSSCVPNSTIAMMSELGIARVLIIGGPAGLSTAVDTLQRC